MLNSNCEFSEPAGKSKEKRPQNEGLPTTVSRNVTARRSLPKLPGSGDKTEPEVKKTNPAEPSSVETIASCSSDLCNTTKYYKYCSNQVSRNGTAATASSSEPLFGPTPGEVNKHSWNLQRRDTKRCPLKTVFGSGGGSRI